MPRRRLLRLLQHPAYHEQSGAKKQSKMERPRRRPLHHHHLCWIERYFYRRLPRSRFSSELESTAAIQFRAKRPRQSRSSLLSVPRTGGAIFSCGKRKCGWRSGSWFGTPQWWMGAAIPAFAAQYWRGGGAIPPAVPSQSFAVRHRSNKMPAAKMFSPEAFPLQGPDFERSVKALAGHARNTYNVLHHFKLLTTPRRWKDELDPGQKNLSFFVSKPDDWFESGALGEFVAALQTVPVLAVCLVRRLGTFKYFATATYNGRVAIFCIRSLEKVCPWREKADLLPPEVRTWLADPDVLVVTSGEKRTFRDKYQGLEISNQIDTERIFQIYQEKGIIHPAIPVERGDLSWQMAFAVGYHASPSKKNTWEQLIGEAKFKVQGRDWPEWRMPGWQPNSIGRLNKQERFFLYYHAYGPLMFIGRLLSHGLLYGGMEAVAGEVPLKDCYLVFLQGAMEEPEMKLSNPLALRSDACYTSKRDLTSPAVQLYKFDHVQTSLEKAEARRRRMARAQQKAALTAREQALFPEQPSSTTDALRDSPPAKEESDPEEGELVEETVELVEEEAEEEPLQINAGEEDLLLLDDNNERECPEDLPPKKSKKDDKLPKKGSRRSEGDIQEALRLLATPSSSAAAATPSRPPPQRTVRVLEDKIKLPEKKRLPLSHRLGPAPDMVEVLPSTSSAPHPGYFTSEGRRQQQEEEEKKGGVAQLAGPAAVQGDPPHLLGDLKEEEGGKLQVLPPPQQAAEATLGRPATARAAPSPSRYHPFDARSRILLPNQIDARQYQNEAKEFPPAPVAVMAPDRNLILAARTARGPKIQRPARRERKRNRKLSKMLLDHPPMTVEQVLNNPYVDQPIFDKRCSFCASWHCSRYLKGSRSINCASFKEQTELAPTRRLCDYRRCGPDAADHHTSVCPNLHARCAVCGCRGHTAAHGCNIRDERVMEKFRYDFEECADVGVYTQKRFDNLAWGFYPYPRSAPRNVVVVSYRRLSDLPVLAALGLLHSVLQMPENRPLPQGGVLESGHRLTFGAASDLHHHGRQEQDDSDDTDD